jgi:cytochrome c-type biogenesis protein CcmH/NrfG
VLKRQRKFDQAAVSLNQALALAPDSAKAWRILGRVREAEGRTADAISNWEQSLRLDPSQPELQRRIRSLQGAEPTP